MARPSEIDRELSSIVLGTTRSPGVVTLSGHDRNQDWDVKTAKGQVGASTALNGRPIGQFSASFYLADDGTVGGENDFDAWDSFQRILESTYTGPKPTALPIYHPDLARNGFTEVVVASIGGMLHDGRGGATVIVKFLEYKPPKPAPAAKPQAKPAAQTQTYANTDEGPRYPPPKPDPNAEAKKELEALQREASAP